MSNRPRMSARRRLAIFEAHKGICHICGCKIDGGRERWDIDHIVAYELTRDDSDANLAPAHEACHRGAGGKTASDIKSIRKAERQRQRTAGVKRTVSRPMPGSVASGVKKHADGRVTNRKTGEQIWPK